VKPNAQALAVAAFAISIALFVSNQAWARLLGAVLSAVTVEALADSASAAHAVPAAVTWASLALAAIASEPGVAVARSVEAVASVVAVVGAALSLAGVPAESWFALADTLHPVRAVHALPVAAAVVLADWHLAELALPHWLSVRIRVADAFAVGLVAGSVLEAVVKLCTVLRCSLMFVLALAGEAVPVFVALAAAILHALSVSAALWVAALCR